MSGKTDNEEYTCTCIDYLDNFFESNKYKISAPLAIGLSVLGGLSSILIGKGIIAGSIGVAITNTSVFFVSILLSKFSKDNKYLEYNNNSLKNENRRLTTFCHELTTNNSINETPQSNDSIESIEPINFSDIHKNNKIASFIFPNE
jgi:hypothetical protein